MTRGTLISATAMRISYPLGSGSKQRSQSAHQHFTQDRIHCVTEVHHGVFFGTGAPARATGHVSASGHYDDHQGMPPASVDQSTERNGRMSATTKRRNRHLTPCEVETSIGSIIRRRPIKEVAHAAGRTVDTVKRWRITALPEAFAALVNLLTYDDEVYLAVMDLAGRKPIGALTMDQRRAVAEALKLLEME